MKKIFLTLAVMGIVASSVEAQKVNATALKDKVEKSVSATKDPKKEAKAATWLALGDAYYAAATANTASVFIGMTTDMMTLALGKPTNADAIESVSVGDRTLDKYDYPNLVVYIDPTAKTVALWEEKTPIIVDALAKAAEAYKKAAELDVKAVDKANEGFTNVANAHSTDGQNYYDLGNYKAASENFAAAAEYSSKNPKSKPEDTNMLAYYAAVAAVQAETYESAELLLNKLVASSFFQDGDTYYYLGLAQDKLGKKAEAKASYLAGIESFIDNSRLITSFIGFALMNQEDPTAVLPYIIKAQEKDAKNPGLFLAEGIVYDQLKDYPKSIIAYDKALAIDPNFFGALYNKGFAYYSTASDINTEIGKTDYTNTKRIAELKGQFLEAMKNSLVPFLKAHEVNKEEKSVVELLRSIYFTLRDENEEMKANYTKYDAILKGM